MRLEHHDYYVFPRVVPADRIASIAIYPRARHAAYPEGTKVKITIIPLEHSTEYSNAVPAVYPQVEAVFRNGALRFSWKFEGEQEHRLHFTRDWANGMNIRHSENTVSVYSLRDDLFRMRPYRGDLHVHTDESDGRECPESVVANYRSYGYDFMALTDHHRMYPSKDAIRYYEQVPTGIRLFPGEEVHTCGTHIHLVNFGGTQSVNEWADGDPEGFMAQVRAVEAQLPELAEGVDRMHYAACRLILDKIREGGGIGIYAHPHWMPHAYHVRDDMTWQLFKDQPFDAFELLGGQSCSENNMQTLIYNEARARGMRFPVVGSSDSHRSTNTSIYQDRSVLEESTIVLSPGCRKESIQQSIREFRSAAVEQYAGEAVPRVYGEYRICKYVMFLLAEVFPQHDELCAVEGGLMRQAVSGDQSVLPLLEMYKDKANDYIERCFSESEI